MTDSKRNPTWYALELIILKGLVSNRRAPGTGIEHRILPSRIMHELGINRCKSYRERNLNIPRNFSYESLKNPSLHKKYYRRLVAHYRLDRGVIDLFFPLRPMPSPYQRCCNKISIKNSHYYWLPNSKWNRSGLWI